MRHPSNAFANGIRGSSGRCRKVSGFHVGTILKHVRFRNVDDEHQSGEKHKYYGESMVNVPWDIATVRIIHTRHFEQKYARRWRWTPEETKAAIEHAYRVERITAQKFEIFTKKGSLRKIIVWYGREHHELICITGSQGGRRL